MRHRRLPVLPLLVAMLVVVPLVELYVLIQVGQVIGAPATILLLILDSLIGAWLLKREGRRAWRAFRTKSTGGGLPTREVAEGALVVFGGALMLTPGFATDVFGIMCVLPPTRRVLARVLLQRTTRKLVAGTILEGLVGERPARTDPARADAFRADPPPPPPGAGRVIDHEP